MAVADATINIVAHDKTQKAFKSVDHNLNRTSDALKGLAKRFIFAAGAAGIGGFVKGTIDAADRLDKLSKRLDIGVSALSEYEHVAKIGGVTFETLTMGMQRLTRRVAEAAGGFGEAKGALKELNIDAVELNKLPLDQKFEVVADALMGLTSESDRVRLAMKLFDSEGVALIQTMEGGAEGIKKVRDEARELGLTIDKETATAAANFNDEMTNLTGAIQGLANEALPALLPLLTNTVEAFQSAIKFIKDWATELKFVALALTNLFVIKRIITLIAGMKAAMAGAAVTARVLGVSLGTIFGGLPGLIATGVAAFFSFRTESDETTESIDDQSEAVERLRKAYGDLNLDQLKAKQTELQIAFADVDAVLKIYEEDLKAAREAQASFAGDQHGAAKAAMELNSVLVQGSQEILELEEKWASLKAQLDDIADAIEKAEKAQEGATETVKDAVQGLTEFDKIAVAVASAINRVNVEIEESRKAISATDQELVDYFKTLQGIEKEKFDDKVFNAKKVALLDVALQENIITLETYREELKKLGIEIEKSFQEKMKDAAKEAADALKDTTAQVKSFVDDLSSGIANAFNYILFEQRKLASEEKKRHGEALADAKERYDDEVKQLQQMLSQGEIDNAEYNKRLKEKYDEYVKEKVSAEEDFAEKMKGINKSIGEQMKDILVNAFKNALQSMIEAWIKSKIYDVIANGFGGGAGGGGGIGSIISSAISTVAGGATGGTAAGGIGSSIMSGLGSIGTAIKSVFSSITSSITTAGTAAGSGFVSSVGSALSAGAGILGPLAIAAFGFAKISKAKKQLKAEFRSLMSDNAITSRLTTEKLVGDYNVLGEHGGRTYVQIGATAAKMYEGLGMWSGKAFGLQRFAMQEMKDEFGNVIIRANNFNELMSILERQEPFVKQAQDLLDLHGPSVIAKEGIELVNSELVRADQAFAQMGQSGVNALMAVNTKSNQYEQIMQKGFVTATQMAQMGLEGFGRMSADVFDIIVRGVQDSEGAMNSLAEAAQIAIDKGRQAASFETNGGGRQHGGSFMVGGGGGTDSQRVSFMATPGERVTVETPNQQRASGSDGGGVVKELRALRADLANVVAKPIVGAVSRGQLAMAGMGRH